MGIGILSAQEVLDLNPAGHAAHRITRPSGDPLGPLVEKSSFDLPLGSEYWVMKGSCRAGKGLSVLDVIRLHSQNTSPNHIADELCLERGKVYLIKLDCHLDLQGIKVQGKSTARSSIGRLDVLVRLLGDKAEEFDRVQQDYVGDLYAEVTPITFDILVRPGSCLSQLRLFRGSESLIALTKEALEYEEDYPVVGSEGDAVPHPGKDPRDAVFPFRLELSPDPTTGFSGFVAKQGSPPSPIDPDKTGDDGKGYYRASDFWEGVEATDGAIYLEPNRLYILRSRERLRLPGHIALECQAYTETMGEWRIEYAGFAHPYFGWSRKEGSPLMFEVRGHNIPTILTQGIPLGNVCFRRMSKPAVQKESQYEKQELKLSSCFKEWSS